MDDYDYETKKRLGIRTPRSTLLPPYLLSNAYYRQYTEAIDEVFERLVDSKIDIVAGLRNMWTTNPDTEQKILDHELLDFTDWNQPERALLVKQANMLGMKLQNAGVLSNDAYQQVTRFVGQYWFEKGTHNFIEFINYCLDADLTVTNLWTEDYEHFVDEASAGTPIWEGGTWYPTTHVEITANGGLQDLDLSTLIAFFYEIANYNLVLYSVDSSYDLPFVEAVDANDTTATIVAIGIYATNAVVLSNRFRYGADSPNAVQGDSLPAQYYGPSGLDLTSAFLLGAPSAWIQDEEGRKFPVYSDTDQIETTSESLPTSMVGADGVEPENLTLLMSPTEWIKIPGSSRSPARMPVYSASPSIQTTDALPTKMVGRLRSYLLASPQGFIEIEPNKFLPYW